MALLLLTDLMLPARGEGVYITLDERDNELSVHGSQARTGSDRCSAGVRAFVSEAPFQFGRGRESWHPAVVPTTTEIGAFSYGYSRLPGRECQGADVLRLRYCGRMGSTTSSFRIPDDLRQRFEAAAEKMGRGKNWILNEALRHYLDRMDKASLSAEARRQSILASQSAAEEGEYWTRLADDRGWI